MSKFKVFNDPIYGLISFPFESIYEIIDHRYFQRLRRISQVGLSNLVYPGATHTRFHHALGTAYLCSELINNLRLKKIDITDEEYEATCIAALLHDVGHGPFSHALEFQIMPMHHEALGKKIIELMNQEYRGLLDMSVEILNNKHPKKFLHQMLSSQLDVDRMDYLNRDSYYTGVAEGIIGYDRIIKMLTVADNELVLEEKGIMSADKFFVSRHLMYRQVYLHKAAISAEQMLKAFFKYWRSQSNIEHDPLFIEKEPDISNVMIEKFMTLDDHDVICLLKRNLKSSRLVLRILSNGLLNRRLFRTIIKKEPFDRDIVEKIRLKIAKDMDMSDDEAKFLIMIGVEANNYYDKNSEVQIKLSGQSHLVPFSQLSRLKLVADYEIMNYISFPKELLISL